VSNSTVLSPVITIGTAYQVNTPQLALSYQLALQPDCSQSGTNQTATPDPSPSR
jgi:hypothetical protein